METYLSESALRYEANVLMQSAFTITEEILTTFLNGFEEPRNEGEIVIEN